MSRVGALMQSAQRSRIISRLKRVGGNVSLLEASGGSVGDSRRHPRASVALAAVMHQGATQSSVTIANISPAGAMIKTAHELSSGCKVHLVRGDCFRKPPSFGRQPAPAAFSLPKT
ncbi:PilZ domain-containing protein [Sphingomonas piscis]|uniref:PilZ domain-containing protein n=1 Tax=Sphingomonas piscis TaxID=2714943 RepID=UPI003CCCCF06